MRIFIVFVISALFSVIFLSNCNFALAYTQNDEIGYSQIHPASPLYFLKSIREILELKFAGTAQTVMIRKLEFATRRIREVKSLKSAGREDLISPTLERYDTYLKFIINNLNIVDTGYVMQFGDSLEKHIKTLEKTFPKIEDKRVKASIRLTMYRISNWNSLLIKKLDDAKYTDFANHQKVRQTILCEFLQKEASSSALGEIEKGVYTKRAQKCSEILQGE